MFICPECEVENRSDAKFCRKCGQARVVLEQKTVTIEGSQAGFFHIGSSRSENSRVEDSRADSFRIESSQVEESQNNNFKSSVGSCDNSNLRIDGGASFDEAIEAVAINNDENARVSDVAGKSDQVQSSKRTDDLIVLAKT